MDIDESGRESPSGIAYTRPTETSIPVVTSSAPTKRKWQFQWNWKWWLLLAFVALPLLRWLSQYVAN